MDERQIEAPDKVYDVAVVGYGPCGEVLTSTLAQAGHTVVAIERFNSQYPLPRMVSFDGEACRTVQATVGDVDFALRNSSVLTEFPYLSAEGERLMVLDVGGEECGFPARSAVFQPEIEAALHESISANPNATVLYGTELVGLRQFEDHVLLTTREFRDGSGQRQRIRAKYVVGADGAGSKVRQLAQMPVYDYGFAKSILNFDTIIKRPLEAKYSKFAAFMDPERVHMYMPIGSERERFEFYVLDDDDPKELESPEVAWAFLKEKHGLTPDDLEITRQVVYTFGSRVVQEWRKGRVFVAGDAAHSMPPSLGQGGCSAIRDARNLAWKLAAVLNGAASESLLDTYELELKPFVTWMVEEATAIARMATVQTLEEAETRNENLRASQNDPPTEWPWLQDGLLSTDHRVQGVVGRLAPQGRLRRGEFDGRGDDLLGANFQMIVSKAVDLDPERLQFLQQIGCTLAVVDGGDGDQNAVDDVDGTYSKFLSANGIESYIMRPDWYVYSAGTLSDVPAQIDELRSHLNAL